VSDFGPMATQTSKPHSSAVGCDFLNSYEGAPAMRGNKVPRYGKRELRVDSFCLRGERDDLLVDEAQTIGDRAADGFTSVACEIVPRGRCGGRPAGGECQSTSVACEIVPRGLDPRSRFSVAGR
jgi:hypothetical protein